MNENTKKRTLILVAAGLLTTTLGLTSSTAEAEQCQIPDPDTQPGGEVAMTLARLQMAVQLPNGNWSVQVPANRLAGITVPAGVTEVEVRLTPAQKNLAVQVASAVGSTTAVFAVHSEAWVDEMEDRLLGGFSVNFSSPVCPYERKWS